MSARAGPRDAPTEGGAPPDPAGERDRRAFELRLALVLNGGVSLAVWMGGVTQEIDALRRAADPPAAGGEAGTTRTDAVYARLLAALDMRVVVDVITGASAGGINGALLAAAIANGRRLDAGAEDPDTSEVKRIWLDDGSFEALVRDPDDPHPAGRPPSLLRGDERLGTRLREACERLMTAREEADPTGRSVSLMLTGTDVRGLRRRVGSDIDYGEHRLRFRFRNPVPSPPTHAGLLARNAGQLAAAARATASFPGAFEPAAVDRERFDAGLTGADGDFDARGAARNARRRWAIDGGVLDNAPFGALVEEVERMGPRAMADRVLLYVTPYRVDLPEPGSAGPRPGLAEVVGRAMSLPRALTAMNDFPRVRAHETRRTQAFEAIRDLLDSLPGETLVDTATELLPAYRRFRLRAVLGAPAEGAPVPEWLPEDRGAFSAPPAGWRFGHAPARRVAAFAGAALSRARVEVERGWEGRDAGWAERLRALRRGEAEVQGALARLAEAEDARRWDMPPAGTAARREWLMAPWSTRQRRRRGLAAMECAEVLVRARRHLEAAIGWDPGPDAPALLRRLLAAEVVLGAGATRPGLDESTPALALGIEVVDPGAGPGGVGDSGRPLVTRESTDPAAKLAGASLRHFGGFVRREWRAGDWRWGRLDGARRLVDLVLTRPRLRLAASDDAGVGALAEALAAVLLDGLDEESAAPGPLRESLQAVIAGADLPAAPAPLRAAVTARLAAWLDGARDEGSGDEDLERLRRAVAWRLWVEIAAEELGGGEGRAAGAPATRTWSACAAPWPGGCGSRSRPRSWEGERGARRGSRAWPARCPPRPRAPSTTTACRSLRPRRPAPG